MSAKTQWSLNARQSRPKPYHRVSELSAEKTTRRSVIGLRPNPSSTMPVLRPIQPRPAPGVQESTPMPTKVGSHQNIQRIVDAYQNTLGRLPNINGSTELVYVPFNGNQMSLSGVFEAHKEEVMQFCQSLDILATLPNNELNDNWQNWLEVLVLRSCWWYKYVDEDDLDVIRVAANYGIHRDSHKSLDQLFMFADTITDMNLHAHELALVTVYLLLMGTNSFQNLTEPQVSVTRQRRELVLNMLYNYQTQHFPDDRMRYVRLLTYLSELTYIARSI